ncbi:MAG TPA: FG-GAP repeat protein, partial [Kofleriaceae bacterium]
MSRAGVLGCVLLAACGRIGFDPTTGDGGAPDDTGDPPLGSRRAYLKAPSPLINAQFGHAVAISSDGLTAAVAAPLAEKVGLVEAGMVHIFRRTGDTWAAAESLFASNADAVDQFGWAVSLSGDGKTLAVGARLEDSGGNPADDSVMDAGAVYVFAETAGALVEQAYIKPMVSDVNDAFGENVALSADGNTLAVSSFYEDSASRVINMSEADNSAADAGAVYIFTRAGTAWTQQAYIKANNTDIGDGFGIGVSLSADGNTLAVGAHREDSANTNPNDNALNNPGAAYVFTRSGTTWTLAAYVKPPTPEAGANFGYSVAVSSDGAHLAVGSIGSMAAGGVFASTGSGAVWSVPTRYGETTPDALDQLGFDTAI